MAPCFGVNFFLVRLARFNLQYRKEGVEETTEGDEDSTGRFLPTGMV